MADKDKTSAWLGFFGAVVVALIGAGVTIWTTRDKAHEPPSQPESSDDSHKGPVVMGPLQAGVNLQGMDFDAYGKAAGNAELCAEMCRTDSDCRAMTYVISMSRCWLKAGVPDPKPPGGADYVSAVKR